MRIKLDENVPSDVAGALAAAGHDVDTSPTEGLGGQLDDAIWAAAQASGRFVITQDMDFSDVRQYAPGTHSGRPANDGAAGPHPTELFQNPESIGAGQQTTVRLGRTLRGSRRPTGRPPTLAVR